jgi:ketosteroid isomerase-like protein
MTGLGAYEGRDAIRGLFDEWWSSYEDLQQLLEEVRDHGNGVTLAVARQRARLWGSGGFVEQRYRAVATWVDRLLERVTTYTDIDQARAAAERLAREPG